MIAFKLKEDWGVNCYLKSDIEQIPKTLIGIRLGPGHIIYELRSEADVIEAYDFEVTFEPDEVKRLALRSDE